MKAAGSIASVVHEKPISSEQMKKLFDSSELRLAGTRFSKVLKNLRTREAVEKSQTRMITYLFLYILINIKRGSLHTKSFRRIHFSSFKNRWIKNRFAGPKSFWDFRETGARWLGDLPEGDVWIPLGGCLWFDEFDFASPAANLHKKNCLLAQRRKVWPPLLSKTLWNNFALGLTKISWITFYINTRQPFGLNWRHYKNVRRLQW